MREAPRPPVNYWATLIAIASLVLTGLNMVMTGGQNLERRLCRLEAALDKGECKR